MSANPRRSYTVLNREDSHFIRFVNLGDLRVAQNMYGARHQSEAAQVESSLMTISATFWIAATYNNGVVIPLVEAWKVPYLGESLSRDASHARYV